MPDKELTDEEIKQLKKNRLSTASFHALKPVFTEGARPTLYDFYFVELKAQLALAEFRVIEHYKEIVEMKEYLGYFLDVGKSMYDMALRKKEFDARKKRGRKQ
jgi:hypothetical protein